MLIDAFVTNDGVRNRARGPRFSFLKDNGVSQPFDLLPAESLPIRAYLVFDTSDSMQGPKGACARPRRLSWTLRPEDEAALVSFSDEISLRVPLTADRSRLRMGILSLQPQGATSAYDALFSALLLPRSALRTLVVLFSDGEDNMRAIRN